MSRCQCCNEALNDFESTMRHAVTNQFLEMCKKCHGTIDAYIPVKVRHDLMSDSDTGNLELLMDNLDDYASDEGDDDMDDYWNER